MNEEKRIENKKADKKALIILIPCLIVAFIVGFGLSAFGNYMEASMADVIAGGIVKALILITPYACLVMNIIAIIVCAILLSCVKRYIKAWDEENEEDYEKIDKNLSITSILINIVFILSYFFFGVGFEFVLKAEYFGVVKWVCYFGGFILALAGNLVIQSKVVNLYKELNPEKQGSVYSMDFGKRWEKSCDEAERMQIYKAAFKSYNFCNAFYIFLWLFCLLGNQIWHFGIMPAAIVIIVWLVQYVSYQAYAAYYSKNPNKV